MSVASLSIIIPFTGEAASLESTLGSVLENRPEGSNIFVVLLKSYDDPYEMNGEDGVVFLDMHEEANPVVALNRALKKADGEIIHVLSVGSEVDEGWADVACQQFMDPEVACVAPRVMDIDRRERTLTFGVVYQAGGSLTSLRSTQPTTVKGLRIAPYWTAGFYRRSVLEALGGFSTKLDLRLAVIDASMAMAHAGWRVIPEPNCRTYIKRSIALPVQSAFEKTLLAERLYWRWVSYGGLMRSMFSHLRKMLGETLSAFPMPRLVPQTLARAVALFTAGVNRSGIARLCDLLDEVRAEETDEDFQPVSFSSYFEEAELPEGKTAGPSVKDRAAA